MASIQLALEHIQCVFLYLLLQEIIHLVEDKILIRFFGTISQLNQLRFNIIVMNRRIVPFRLLARIRSRYLRLHLLLHLQLLSTVSNHMECLLFRIW